MTDTPAEPAGPGRFAPAAEQRSQRDRGPASRLREEARAAAQRMARDEAAAVPPPASPAIARLRLQVAQLQHLVAQRDAIRAGVPADEVLAEAERVAERAAAIMTGRENLGEAPGAAPGEP